ncbi:MAG: glutamine--fructose-6-phosphate transaminase (isomerizing) [Candidatus Omnitrophota bacterium]
MCGIVGYIGNKDAKDILIEGLSRLEYRGYDSAGIAVLNKGKIYCQKTSGKIKELIKNLEKHPLPESTLGISHTRWATHGAATDINAHPHLDCKKEFAIVHNGIIENYQELKTRLIKKGHKFHSSTDTEVIVHLIESLYQGDLEEAFRKAINQLRGSFALGLISKDEPDKLFAARRFSPLIIGLGKDENFIASDAPAILNHTRKVIYLGDDEMAILEKGVVRVKDLKGKSIEKKVNTIKWDIKEAEKQGFAHFMLKEIHEQPKVSRQIISTHIDKDDRVYFQEFRINQAFLKEIRQIIILACGTAYHAGLVAKYVIEKLTDIPVWVDFSSEFRYRGLSLKKNTLVIAISQSGETADTLAAVKEAQSKGAYILAICNVVGSSLARESNSVIYTHAGPEIGVASTKAYTAQILILDLLAIYLADLRGGLAKNQKSFLISELKRISHLQELILKKESDIATIAHRHSHFGCFLYLGRNVNFPSALEGALKLKEISYIPAEGYAAGEMKHGPIALIDEYRAVVCIATESDIYDKMVSNIQEIRSRQGKVVAIATEEDASIKLYVREVIYIPRITDLLSPGLVALPLQLLAYHIATKRGCDVDQPRNLAKSVTVE